MPLTPIGIESALRMLLTCYRHEKLADNLGAAISQREEVGKFVVQHGDEILLMLHRYNAPLSEPVDDEIPF